MRDVQHLDRFIADEGIQEEAVSIPDLYVQVLLHELKVARLVSNLDFRLEVGLRARIKVADLLSELRNTLCSIRQVDI